MNYQAARRFIREWWAAPDMHAFCAAMAFDRREASNQATALRRKGVLLKDMPPGHISYSGDKLSPNELAKLQLLSRDLASGHQPIEPEDDDPEEEEDPPEPAKKARTPAEREEKERAGRIQQIKEAADKQRDRVSQASAWSSVEGADE